VLFVLIPELGENSDISGLFGSPLDYSYQLVYALLAYKAPY